MFWVCHSSLHSFKIYFPFKNSLLCYFEFMLQKKQCKSYCYFTYQQHIQDTVGNRHSSALKMLHIESDTFSCPPLSPSWLPQWHDIGAKHHVELVCWKQGPSSYCRQTRSHETGREREWYNGHFYVSVLNKQIRLNHPTKTFLKFHRSNSKSPVNVSVCWYWTITDKSVLAYGLLISANMTFFGCDNTVQKTMLVVIYNYSIYGEVKCVQCIEVTLDRHVYPASITYFNNKC